MHFFLAGLCRLRSIYLQKYWPGNLSRYRFYRSLGWFGESRELATIQQQWVVEGWGGVLHSSTADTGDTGEAALGHHGTRRITRTLQSKYNRLRGDSLASMGSYGAAEDMIKDRWGDRSGASRRETRGRKKNTGRQGQSHDINSYYKACSGSCSGSSEPRQQGGSRILKILWNKEKDEVKLS